jgi:hypothetical protein
MSYSYQKQIERLLTFVKELYDEEYLFDAHQLKAWNLLHDEPVRLNTTTYGLLENPKRQAPERKYNYPRYF